MLLVLSKRAGRHAEAQRQRDVRASHLCGEFHRRCSRPFHLRAGGAAAAADGYPATSMPSGAALLGYRQSVCRRPQPASLQKAPPMAHDEPRKLAKRQLLPSRRKRQPAAVTEASPGQRRADGAPHSSCSPPKNLVNLLRPKDSTLSLRRVAGEPSGPTARMPRRQRGSRSAFLAEQRFLQLDVLLAPLAPRGLRKILGRAPMLLRENILLDQAGSVHRPACGGGCPFG